jgi:hypothetical protein
MNFWLWSNSIKRWAEAGRIRVEMIDLDCAIITTTWNEVTHIQIKPSILLENNSLASRLLAKDAVCREPVSRAKIPINREKYREFWHVICLDCH